MDERWNLDRKPTPIERSIGIGGAFLLCALGAAGLWLSVFVKRHLVASLSTGAFTALSMAFLARLIFTGGRELRRPGIIATTVVFIVVGLLMLVGGFFADGLRERLLFLALGASGIGGGLLNISRVKKKPNQ